MESVFHLLNGINKSTVINIIVDFSSFKLSLNTWTTHVRHCTLVLKQSVCYVWLRMLIELTTKQMCVTELHNCNKKPVKTKIMHECWKEECQNNKITC